MSTKQDTFSTKLVRAIGTQWNDEKLVFVPEDITKRSYVAKCKYIQDNKMIIEKKNGDIAFISIDKYSDIRLLYPKNCAEVDQSEVV